MTATATANRTLSWFEIPAINFERAVRFYEAALDQPMRRELFGGVPMAIFASDEDATGGAIIHNPRELRPSVTGDGVTIYLAAEPTLQATLDRVTPAGGKIDGSIVELPNDIGYIAFFIDPEGNRIGLHARHLR